MWNIIAMEIPIMNNTAILRIYLNFIHWHDSLIEMNQECSHLVILDANFCNESSLWKGLCSHILLASEIYPQYVGEAYIGLVTILRLAHRTWRAYKELTISSMWMLNDRQLCGVVLSSNANSDTFWYGRI